MPYISLNLNDPAIRKIGANVSAIIGFDICILHRFMDAFPYFNVPIINKSMIKAADKNLIFIFLHKCRKPSTMLSCLYIEYKNKKKKFVITNAKKYVLSCA
jgi:hypothetical protein